MTAHDSGVALVPLDRFRFDRLPRLMASPAPFLAGECRDSDAIRSLHEAIGDAGRLLSNGSGFPELAFIFGGRAVRYPEIATHALDNAHRRCRNAHAV